MNIRSLLFVLRMVALLLTTTTATRCIQEYDFQRENAIRLCQNIQHHSGIYVNVNPSDTCDIMATPGYHILPGKRTGIPALQIENPLIHELKSVPGVYKDNGYIWISSAILTGLVFIV